MNQAWNDALAKMDQANLVTAALDPTKGTLAQKTARYIAEQLLDRYFEMVETELNRGEQQCLTS
jgi:multidrug efflux pump subunit AcrA (membrane-fusion protein)